MTAQAEVHLLDIEPSLTLFVEGMAGRYLHVKSVEEHTGRMFDPDRPQTTETNQSTDTLYLPATLETFDAPETTRGLYRLLAMQQLAFRDFGTFAFRRDIALAQLPLTERRPPDRRLSDLTWFFLQFEIPQVARGLFELVEIARVTHRMLGRCPGLKKYFAHYTPVASLDGLQPLADMLFDGDNPMLAPLFEPDADVYVSASITIALYDELGLQIDAGADAEPGSIEWMQRMDRLEEWEESLTDMDANMTFEADAADMEAEFGEDQDGAERTPDAELRTKQNDRDTLARRIEMERSSIRDALGNDRTNTRSYRYDEWDNNNHRYLKHWCCLYESSLNDDIGDTKALLQAIQPHVAGVQKTFQQIKPLGYERVRRIVDGDEMDWNALIEARVDLKVGRTPDDRIYVRRERIHRDVTCAFLVDLSASTDDPVEKPEPAVAPDGVNINLRDPFDDDEDVWGSEPPEIEEKRRIIDVLRESVGLMAAALGKLGDAYGIYGFSGYGRDNVEYFVAKEPAEPFNAAVLNAVAAMAPKRSTRMGPAIRHTINKLKSSGSGAGSGQKLMIIISDGFPQDCDYGPERGNHVYGLADTAKALEEAKNAGVESFCITVDRSGHDYLKRMCPDNRYMVIEELDALPEALAKVYQALAR